MGFDYAPADGQTNPHSGLFGGVRKVEIDWIGRPRSGSYSGIGYDDLDHIAGNAGVRHHGFPRFAALPPSPPSRCETSITQNLLDLNPIGEDQVLNRIKFKPQRYATLSRADKPQGASLIYQPRNAFDTLLGLERATKSRSRRTNPRPARIACSAALSKAASIFGALGSGLAARSRREPFM